MKKDFILTFLTQIIILLSGLAVFKLAMIQFGDIGFSEFSLVKRNLAYIYTLILIGLGVAVPRYIAMAIGEKLGKENDVFLAAFFIMFISLFLTIIIILIFPKYISILLFGSQDYIRFLLPIFISLVGLSLQGIIYAYYRGKMIFNYANFLQVINTGIIPLVVFLFANNIEEVFMYTGVMMSILSLIVLARIFFSNTFNMQSVKQYIPKLFYYGIQRLPADFGLASLVALPVILSAHSAGVIVAGYIAFSISLLSLSGQVVAPIGLIMLPKISHLLSEKNFILIQFYIKKLFLFSLLISIIGTSIYQIFAEEILALYLGEVKVDLINISKNIMWGALFYPFYVTMRSIVDAYYARAYNTISILSSLVTFVSLYFIINNIYNSLTIALAVLSLMTLYFIRPLLLKSKNEII